MKRSKTSRRGRAAVTATILCVLIGSLLAISSSPAAAEPPEASTLPTYDGSGFPIIHGPSDPEEFSWHVEVGSGATLRQISETEAQVVYKSGVVAFTITAEPAHDTNGATVPTTLRVAEGDVVTLTVHHRAGNPAAGSAPFAYPILDGPGWEGGGYSTVFIKGPPDEAEEKAAAAAAAAAAHDAPPAVAAPEPTPVPVALCRVPALHGLSLHAAKVRLRADECAIGPVGLARGATAGKGHVIRQSSPAGTLLAAGAPIALRLGVR